MEHVRSGGEARRFLVQTAGPWAAGFAEERKESAMWSELSKRSLVAAGVCVLLAASAAVAEMIVLPVAASDEDEVFPTVAGNTVVWQFYNARYDDWDVEGADLAEGAVVTRFQITDVPGTDAYPVIDGNDVVWQHEYRPGLDWDIHAADISDRGHIGRYIVTDSANDERLPHASDGVVVWQDMLYGASDWDILGAPLTGAAHPPYFSISAGADINEMFPCISGSLVVWSMKTLEVPQPFAWGADISDPCEPRIFYTTMALGEHEFPFISDGWLVGRDTDEAGRVWLDNLFDPFNPEEISRSGQTACPKIHRHIVVWQDGSNGTWDIRAYNRITGEEIVVTDRKMSEQVNPSVYVDAERERAVIVWQDNRDGNWDVYAAILDAPASVGQLDAEIEP
jgi:hypothetical protein